MLYTIAIPIQYVAGVIAAVATGWAITRTQGLAAWRAVADARGEELKDVRERLARSEEVVSTMHKEIERFESMPDLTEVVTRLEVFGETITKKLDQVVEALDAS